jgi:hypothetical protein
VLIDFVEQEKALDIKRRMVREQNSRRVVPKLLEFIKLSALRQRIGLVEGTTNEEQQSLSDLAGPEIELFRKILSQAKTRVNLWGGTLSFVYLPHWSRYDGRLGDAEQQRAKILMVVNDLGIPIIDLLPTFQAQSDPLSLFPFRRPGHYTEEGHRLVAEEVLKAISLNDSVTSDHGSSN